MGSLTRTLLCCACLLSIAALTAACSDETHSPGWEIDPDAPGICENGCEPLSACQGELPEEKIFASEESHTSLTDLELEPTGCPRVLFEQEDRVEYAEWDGDEWLIETVAHNRPVSSSHDVKSGLAIDARGRPSVGVIDEDRNVQFVRRDAEGQWESERLSGIEGRAAYVVHEIDPTGRPVLLVSTFGSDPDASESRLYYAELGEDGWAVDKLPEDLWFVSIRDSLAFDDRGRVHLGFSGGSNGGLSHAVRSRDGDWSIERIADETNVAFGGANVALDAEDNVHMLYCPPPGQEETAVVTHVQSSQSDWQSRIVDEEDGYAPWCNALGFDANDRLHALYLWQREPSRVDLRHATFDEGEWQVDTLETGDYLKPSPRMAIDARLDIAHVFVAGDYTPENGWTVSPRYSHFPLDGDEPDLE